MMNIPQEDLALLMIATIFLLGMCTFLLGIFVLAKQALGSDLNTLKAQTSELAQKGITQDVAGLVGNASALMDALQQLVRTTAGIGIFLTLTGLGMISTSIWLTSGEASSIPSADFQAMKRLRPAASDPILASSPSEMTRRPL